MTDLAVTTASAMNVSTVESVLLGGDLSKLAPQQRVAYYMDTCTSLGLNYRTRPFDYITLNGKLTLYARKDAADQLRKLHSISIEKPDITFQDDWIIVTVLARTKDGRTDADTGAVNKKDMRGDFGNSLMKAITKAKRRVTLSICGLGMLDETEVDGASFASPVTVDAQTGEIAAPATPVNMAKASREPGEDDDWMGDALDGATAPESGVPSPLPHANGSPVISDARRKRLYAITKNNGWPEDVVKAHLAAFGYLHSGDIAVAHYDTICQHFDQPYDGGV